MKRAAAILAIALLASACSPAAARNCAPTGLTSNGELLPDCTLATLNGPPLRLPDGIKGTPTVLNFWASWCTACTAEMPAFERVSKRAGASLRVLGVDAVGISGETRAAGTAFAARLRVTYPVAFDDAGGLYYHFQKRPTLPITVFVDARGIVADFHIGQLDEGEIVSAVSRNLGVAIP